MISIGKHFDEFLVGTFLVKLCWATILKDPPNLVQELLVQKSLQAGNYDVGITVSTDMVTPDRSMDCGEVHIKMKQHGRPHLKAVIINFRLVLPIHIGLAQWGPINILDPMVFVPEAFGGRKRTKQAAQVAMNEKSRFKQE
jgi:hypothetical protein